MEWCDTGVVLGCRILGETSVVVEALTREQGRCFGLVRGGRSRRYRPMLQPGNIVELTWRARLEEHLGVFAVEPVDLCTGLIMEDPLRLAGLTTLAGLAGLLPEREPQPGIYDAARFVLDAFDDDQIWPALLARWEMGLLDALGFGLDLETCAATGAREDLRYVSPRSGRAVSADAGEPYRDRLLILPQFLKGGLQAQPTDVVAAFELTTYFMDRHIFSPRQIDWPHQRTWMIERLRVRAEESLCLDA
jgi:DNA repair protein RecO (recombination protein O)